MWKIGIGITIGIALGIGGAWLLRSNPVPNITEPATTAPVQSQANNSAVDLASEGVPDPGDYGFIRVIYKARGVIVVERMRNQNRLLVILQDQAFEIGPVWDFGVHVETQSLDDGGELFTAVFKTGTGTGVSSHDALVIRSHPDQPPAVAQLWHHGYSANLQGTTREANTVSYDVQGNTLVTHFEYFDDGIEPVVAQTHTDTIELIPGEFITHGCKEMLAHCYAMPWEDNESAAPPPDLDTLTHRDLIAETDEQTQWVSITLIENEKRIVLHAFRARQNIYDIAISPDGRFGYVWHDEYNPRKLSIFDLDTREKITTFVPGIGGTLRWSPGNTICHNYGFGTNTFGYLIYDTQGNTIADGASTGGDFSPDGRYLATFPSLFAGTDPVRIINTTTGEVIRGISEDEQGRTIEVVTNIDWHEQQLTLHYFHSLNAETGDWTSASMTIELPR